MGMLDRIREPRAAGEAPSLRGVLVRASLLPLDFTLGVSRTRRRNCVLFMVVVEGPVSEVLTGESSSCRKVTRIAHLNNPLSSEVIRPM